MAHAAGPVQNAARRRQLRLGDRGVIGRDDDGDLRRLVERGQPPISVVGMSGHLSKLRYLARAHDRKPRRHPAPPPWAWAKLVRRIMSDIPREDRICAPSPYCLSVWGETSSPGDSVHRQVAQEHEHPAPLGGDQLHGVRQTRLRGPSARCPPRSRSGSIACIRTRHGLGPPRYRLSTRTICSAPCVSSVVDPSSSRCRRTRFRPAVRRAPARGCRDAAGRKFRSEIRADLEVVALGEGHEVGQPAPSTRPRS